MRIMRTEHINIGPVDENHPYEGIEIDWTVEPDFRFENEVAALMTLEDLGQQLQAAREQVRHVMRWMAAAVVAARNNGEGQTSKQAIIGNSGLARQTVYTMLGES